MTRRLVSSDVSFTQDFDDLLSLKRETTEATDDIVIDILRDVKKLSLIHI